MSHETLIILAAHLLTAAFVYGRLTEKVRGHGQRINKAEENQEKIQTAVTRHEGEIGELFGHAGIHRG